ASIHAIQVCVPNALLLPVGIERLEIFGQGLPGRCIVEATERSHDSDHFTYDVEVRAADGSLLEKWDALTLKMVRGTSFRGPWVEPLLAAYLERCVREYCDRTDLSVCIERVEGERQERSDHAIGRILGADVAVTRREDGKPDSHSGRALSTSHCGEVTMAVAARELVACDVEEISERESCWKDLLGSERYRLCELISQSAGDSRDVAATRVWTAVECLKKAAAPANAPLMLSSSGLEGWVIFSSGRLLIGTFFAEMTNSSPMIFAILLNN